MIGTNRYFILRLVTRHGTTAVCDAELGPVLLVTTAVLVRVGVVLL